jgi:flagellin
MDVDQLISGRKFQMIINHNIASLNTQRQLSTNTANQSKNIEKLSSGLRINRAGDDAAGLAISEKMRGQIRGLDQASRNAQDGISMIQTAEGALNETHSILQRMRELAVQSSNDTNTASDRGEIQKEVDQLSSEITRIANNTEFNTQNLLNGGITSGKTGEVKFQIGANSNQNLSINIKAMDAASLGVAADKTTNTGTTAGNIDTATFADTVGAKVVDGAALTFDYADVAAAAGKVTGSAAAGAVTTGGALQLKIDGTAVNVTITDGDAAAAVVTAINTAANTAMGTTGKTYAALNGGKLEISSVTTGTTSSSEVVGATGPSNTILADLNIAVGSDSGEAAKKTVTISNGTTADDQVVEVTSGDATSLSVTTGNYSGLTIKTDAGKKLSNLDSTTDTVTVKTTTEAAAAATFGTDGKKTTDAVASAGINVSTQAAASTAITTIQSAIETVSAERSKLGAYQNRLEHTINNLNTSSENLTASESRIRDVDMAKEMSDQTKNSILAQAAQAMLAQANQQPQGVLQLLR